MKIKLIKSTFYREEEVKSKLCDFIKNSLILSMGEQCKRFEKLFSMFQRRKYSVFVNSGSSANLLLIRSLINMGLLKKGDRVGISALTWSTNVMPIIELGMKPILIDCDMETLNISTTDLKKKELDALFITNVLGFSANLFDIKDYCEREGILLLEDNCESLGSEYKNKLLGNFGHASTFSFFVGHHLSTIEGGMVCTDNKELYDNLIISRAHGWSRNLDEEKRMNLRDENGVDPFYEKYTFYELAYNLRPTEINGFLGNEQIVDLVEIVDKREKNYLKILESIKKNEKLTPILGVGMTKISNFAVPLVFKTRWQMLDCLKKFEELGIETRPIISGNIANQPFFKKNYSGYGENQCNNAELIHNNAFYIGNNPEMTEEELNFVVEAIENV